MFFCSCISYSWAFNASSMCLKSPSWVISAWAFQRSPIPSAIFFFFSLWMKIWHMKFSWINYKFESNVQLRNIFKLYIHNYQLSNITLKINFRAIRNKIIFINKRWWIWWGAFFEGWFKEVSQMMNEVFWHEIRHLDG